MAGEFVIWKYKTVKHATGVAKGPGSGFNDVVGELMNGVSLAAAFPPNARMAMPADRPNDTVLPDNVYNTDMLIVASQRLKTFLEQRKLPEVEYLPVAVLNHKGDPVGDPFFIVHPLSPLDCVDESQSSFDRSDIDGSYEEFEHMVIDPDRVPPERALFRIKGYWDATLVRRPLAEALLAAGFTGLSFAELPAED